METSQQTITEILTTTEGSGDIETTIYKVTEIITTTDGSGDGETAQYTVTKVYTTPDGSDYSYSSPQPLTEIYTTREGSGDIETTQQTLTEMLTTADGSGDIETTPKTLTEVITTEEGSGDIETTTFKVSEIITPADGSGDGKFTEIHTGTPEESGGIKTTNIDKVIYTTHDLSTLYVTTAEGSEESGTALSIFTESSTKLHSTEQKSGEIATSSIIVTKTYAVTLVPTVKATEGVEETYSTAQLFPSTGPSTSSPPTTNSPSTIRVSTATTTTTTTGSPNGECRNGGIHDGIKCICQDEFYGPQCENLLDRVIFGKTVNTSVNVVLSIPNRIFHLNLTDKSTQLYKDFEVEFKSKMINLYSGIPGYLDVVIHQIRNGSVIVNHDAIVEIEFKEDVSVRHQYTGILQQFKELMEENCTEIITSTICIEEIMAIIEITPLTEEELCKQKISFGFKDYYDHMVTAEGLICESHCSPSNSKAPDCNGGHCEIQNTTGPHCLCPETDLYIYTSSKCHGKILKTGVYGGVGASITILFIGILLMIFFLFRQRTGGKWDTFANELEDNWYEDKEDEWHVDRGFTNLFMNSDEDSSTNNSSNIKNFTPALENIDTTLVVKIPRPEISTA
ncbi:mucin-17-like [Mixophyes fleayi]|uniref:mucin-17-like n=1 Tax=Mixophyes fleayi TaxID=3061075 RepID=UPI003F4DCB1B